ncbi:TonB-dependent receptor [Paraflavisolibacter sp. H34]|uniref:TonB-dependent receptor n=1 Tax=Huijunlia imazamoxiresistens TaxID=3127457 RepID=UPI003016D969
MGKNLRTLATLLVGSLISVSAHAQAVRITGTVTNRSTHESVPAISIVVKGGSNGTFSNEKGAFSVQASALPVTLVFSSVGYETKEVVVTSDASLSVELEPGFSLGQEVIVAASRSMERALESPVTVERMSGPALRNLPAPTYYEGIANLKGVDMHTASLTFRTVTTRGFIVSGNNRLNQLVDGMDNQAPGLNFAVGNIAGLTELDADNVELLAGASSALYGSGGMNGTLLINSKNPFKYQGLSAQVKQGVMHLNDPSGKGATPFYNASIRYARAFKDKFAFKIAGEFVKADDWQAYDSSNVRRANIISNIKDGNRQTDPNFDGVNIYGDETSANMSAVAMAVREQTRQGILAQGGPDIVALMNGQLPANATPAQVGAFINSLPAPLRPAVTNLVPFYFGLRNGIIPNQNVSRTGYAERDLVDYGTLNVKGTAGIFYKINPNLEASFNSYLGTGTTVYTGTDRYSLNNFRISQHKLELKATNWFVRGYTTQENAGDSYNATALGRLVNEAWKGSTAWYPQYTGAFVAARAAGQTEAQAHAAARTYADQGRVTPGTDRFNQIADSLKKVPIPNGARFLDKSDLWAAEAQLNFSEAFNFSSLLDVLGGVQWKNYVLNSQGTLFADTAGKIGIHEYGGYLQLRKKLFSDVLTLTAAGRYDKHTNFKGRFTPRLTAVVKVAKDNNLRFSYQVGYRFPTNRDQYINLATSSVTLIGGLPEFQDYYNLNTNKGYTAESIDTFRRTGNAAALKQYTYKEMKPETVTTYEAGYKGLIGDKLLLDAYGYYSVNVDFIGVIAVGQAQTGQPAALLNPATTNNFAYPQNSEQNVKTYGWGASLEYQLPQQFILSGNVYSDRLRDVPAGYATFFNAPKYRFNAGLRNENIYKNIGVNLVYKWQDENQYEGTFVSGTLPSFGWLDAQVSFKLPQSKVLFRLGGTNLLNNYQRTGFGSPYVGGLYYASVGYNVF